MSYSNLSLSLSRLVGVYSLQFKQLMRLYHCEYFVILSHTDFDVSKLHIDMLKY